MSTRAGRSFTRLVEIMATLRGPEGCPWDREQTLDSLKPFVLEEAYEVIDAIDRHDHAALREELGDFLFEAVFLAELEAEAGRFDMADAIEAVADKLVRRHPHVFAGEASAPRPLSADQVRTRWEEIKARERGAAEQPGTLLSGIAPALPALLRAWHISQRAASVGFDWTAPGDVVEKIEEEVAELRQAVSQSGQAGASAEDEMGDLLFSIANLSRKLGIEPETALRKANDKFTRRFEQMERAILASGRTMGAMTLDEWEREWQRAKSEPQHAQPQSARSPRRESSDKSLETADE